MDSVYKEWNERIDELANDDFREGVLKAIRQLKDEVYHLKVDNYNQSLGRVIRDDKRIVLSAPEIIIGDVNLGGMLNPGGESRVILRGGDISLQGAGDVGKIDMRAPVIEQIAENPGIDGNEHVVGEVSRMVSQAANITIQSDTVGKDGAFPPVGNMSEVGIRIKSDHQVDISATASHDNLLAQIEQQIERLKTSNEALEEQVGRVRKEFKTQQEEIDDLLEKKSKLAKADNAVRTDYHDMDELNIRIEELSTSLTETVYRYTNLLSMMAESARLLNYFKSRKEEVQKENAADFKTDSTLASVNIASETVNVSSMDGDHHVRTNETAGVNILTHAMSVFGDIDEKGALLDGNRLFVNMKTVDIATSGSADMETDDQDVLTKAQYEAQGDVFIRSKNITLESVDYEVADKKRREKGLTADGRILLRSKTIEASTVNSKDVEVDEKGLITKATYTSEGDVIVRSRPSPWHRSTPSRMATKFRRLHLRRMAASRCARRSRSFLPLIRKARLPVRFLSMQRISPLSRWMSKRKSAQTAHSPRAAKWCSSQRKSSPVPFQRTSRARRYRPRVRRLVSLPTKRSKPSRPKARPCSSLPTARRQWVAVRLNCSAPPLLMPKRRSRTNSRLRRPQSTIWRRRHRSSRLTSVMALLLLFQPVLHP